MKRIDEFIDYLQLLKRLQIKLIPKEVVIMEEDNVEVDVFIQQSAEWNIIASIRDSSSKPFSEVCKGR